MKLTVTIGLPVLFLVIIWSIPAPGVHAASQGSWTQRSQQDFQSDITTNLDTSTSPGAVQLSALPPSSFGNVAINRGGGNSSGVSTFITGEVAPVSGSVVGYRFYTNAGCTTIFCCFPTCPDYNFQLDVLRNNGTYYKLVGQSPLLIADFGLNEISLGTPMSVRQGDILGFYLGSQLLVPYSVGGLSSSKDAVQVTGDTPISAWSCAVGSGLFCTTVSWSVQADIVPTEIGTLFSSIRDTGGISTWGKIFWNTTTTGTGSTSFASRSSADAISWSPWSSSYANNSAVISPSGRYLQYRVVFNGSASSSLTPVLHSVTITYSTTPAASSIIVAVSAGTSSPNSAIMVTGMISPPTVATVTLTYTKPDGSNLTRAVISTGTGFFEDTYTPDQSGTWKVTASWAGTSQTASAQSAPESFQVQSQPSFLQTYLPWLVLAAVVVGFGAALVITKPKAPKA